ncbi:MAG: sulfurtransferase [Candidatus Solibacter sp.]|nr:sulfurtransferase [Candidatus Solibacter sp.]
MQHVNEFLALVNDAKTRVKEIDIQGYVALKEAGTPHVLIDTREESEWGRGHLPGAIHLGKGIIERDIVSKVPDKSTTLVLYCGGGFRSALAGDNLMKMGYQDVISMDGGWTGWNKAGLPVEKD